MKKLAQDLFLISSFHKHLFVEDPGHFGYISHHICCHDYDPLLGNEMHVCGPLCRVFDKTPWWYKSLNNRISLPNLSL